MDFYIFCIFSLKHNTCFGYIVNYDCSQLTAKRVPKILNQYARPVMSTNHYLRSSHIKTEEMGYSQGCWCSYLCSYNQIFYL